MRGHRFGFLVCAVVGAAAWAAACDETIDAVKLPPDAGSDAASTDGATEAAPTTDAGDSGTPVNDAGDAGVDAAAALVTRGDYLVNHVAACGDCHTPRLNTGAPDMAKFLSGVECFAGVDLNTLDGGADGGDAGDAGPPPVGCLNSRNLTNDPTGLQNRSDAEIIEMFKHGKRPNGESLVPVMPYWMYGNMTDDDAKAIVAYLRTVPGINHAVPANQMPWSAMAAGQPAPTLNLGADGGVPPALADGGMSATNGRYLATSLAGCIDCHTPEKGPGQGLDSSKYFAGNRPFEIPGLGTVYSANLTSDSTGLAGYTTGDITRILKLGIDKTDGGVCPPMPAGPHGPFGGMTDGDALDIATYILSLPPIVNTRPNCVIPH